MPPEEVQSYFEQLLRLLMRFLPRGEYTGEAEDEPLMRSPIATSAQDALQACCTMLGTLRYVSHLLELTAAISGAADEAWLPLEVCAMTCLPIVGVVYGFLGLWF